MDARSLASVSCTSAEVCTRVGYTYNTAGVDVPLAERGWNRQRMEPEAGDHRERKSSNLTSVSCNKENIFVYDTIAKGHNINQARLETPFAEVWNPVSGEWYLDEVPVREDKKTAVWPAFRAGSTNSG